MEELPSDEMSRMRQMEPGRLPHCAYCGTELPDEAYSTGGVLPWQLEMKDKEKPKAYIRVDDDGQYEETDDPRDALADEMVSLKERKLAGEEEQRRLRRKRPRGVWLLPGVLYAPPATALSFFFRL